MHMITATQLEEVIRSQKDVFLSRDTGITREVDAKRYRKSGQIVVISGIRRSGKSTLLRQFSGAYEAFHYINFDDDRLLDFSVEDFSTLGLICEKTSPGTKVIFIDEIQNIPGWERFVRRIHDEGWKVYLTGSNANLLSAELGTHLTGRYAKVERFPFSFREMLRFKGISPSVLTQKKKAEILREFDLYLMGGGFPEYLKYGDKEFLKLLEK